MPLYEANGVMTHWHHVVPRHHGGSDDANNLIELTVADHAEEHRAKLRAAKLGRTLAPEHVANAAAASRGKKRSVETKEKISAAIKEHWEKRKSWK